ncbi:MAG: sugar transferase [Elusimicrobia bacterium]|nr:sugar transferase [Elusimicrobiota bacterium]
MKKHSHTLFICVLFAGDLLLLYFSFVLGYYIRFFWASIITVFPPFKGIPNFTIYNELFKLAILVWLPVFIFVGFYKKKIESDLDDLVNVVKGTVIATILLMAITFVYRDVEFSRFVIGIIWVISSILIFIWHLTSKYVFQLIITHSQNVLIIGKIEEIEILKKTFRRNRHIKPFFLFDYKNEENIFNLITQKDINEILVMSSLLSKQELIDLSDKCEEKKIELKIVPDLLQLKLGEILIDDSLGIPVFRLKSPSLVGANFYYKKMFDIFLSIVFLSFSIVPLIFIAIFIKLDSKGKILYSHQRMGYKGRVFNFFKFRTMMINADEMLEKIKHLTERKGPVFKMKNDPRITKIGKFLRRYSIDEIPQIINILRGEMSWIGPRPQVLWEAKAYDNWAKRRLSVLPGATGLWQVSGRASLSYEEMIELDIFYLENWSLGLDLKILLKTLPAIFSRKGAY